MSVYCVCGGKCIMFDHFDSRDPSRLLCIIAMTMTLFIPWPFHHHRPIDQHTTASGLSTWWFGAREGKCHCSALGLVDGTRATTHRAWRGWPWRERWGQMVDGGCTGEENIGKHGYLFEKNVPHTGTWWTWDIWSFGLEKTRLACFRLACFTMLEPMYVALVNWLDSRNPLCSCWIWRFLA